MKALRFRKYCYFLVSLFILITGLFGIKGLITKADLPFSYSYQNSETISTERFGEIIPGDIIYSVNGINIKSLYQLENILDNHSISEDVNIEILSSSDLIFKPNIHLVRYYRKLDFIIISFLVGMSFWMTSVFLAVKNHGSQAVTVLFWVLSLFSLATMTSPGSYSQEFGWIDYTVRVSHVVSYFFGAITFLHFTIVFPRNRIKESGFYISILYVLSFLFSIILIAAELFSITDNASGWTLTMEKIWQVTEVVLILCITAGTLNLYLYYIKINDIPERKKTEWIFWGIATGVCPFLFLWLLPRIFGYNELIREEFLLMFMILVPVFFAMAVVKYHVFEIEVFIKKSILYSSLIILTVFIYKLSIMVILFFAEDLIKEYHTLVTSFIILLEIFFLNPTQKRLRTFIDKSFYMVNYDFKNSVCMISAGIKDQITVQGLCKYVIDEIEKIIPVKKIAIVATTESGDRFRILSHKNFDELQNCISPVMVNHIKTDFSKIIAANGKAEPGINADNSLTEDLKKYEIDIVIPFVLDLNNNAGAILLGDKLSGLSFDRQDIEVLIALIPNLVLALFRLSVH